MFTNTSVDGGGTSNNVKSLDTKKAPTVRSVLTKPILKDLIPLIRSLPQQWWTMMALHVKYAKAWLDHKFVCPAECLDFTGMSRLG